MNKFEGITTRELVEELQRRFAEMEQLRTEAQQLLGLQAAPAQTEPHIKRPSMSRAKTLYWQERKAKAEKLGITVGEVLAQERMEKAKGTQTPATVSTPTPAPVPAPVSTRVSTTVPNKPVQRRFKDQKILVGRG